MKVGYARVSTNEQDLTAQWDGLAAPGVGTDDIYVDHGLTGANRARPGLREAMAALRKGDTLVVTKLDRPARSLPAARDIADEPTRHDVAPSLGGSVNDPTDPVGRLLSNDSNVLGMVAEFDADPIRVRTREGMAAKGARPAASSETMKASTPKTMQASCRVYSLAPRRQPWSPSGGRL